MWFLESSEVSMRGWKQSIALGALALMVVGCGDATEAAIDHRLQLGEPITTSQALVYLDAEFEEIVVIRPEIDEGAPGLDVERHETGERPVQMEVSADRESLYVLNRDDETLSVFDVDEQDVERQDVALDSVYDRITVDPEGEFLLLSNSGEADDAVVQNLNELGIVELDGDLPERARVMSLPTEATELRIGPAFEMDGQPQRLAAALAPDEVAIVDFYAEEDYDQVRTTPLTGGDSKTIHEPTQVLFDVPDPGSDSELASLFVLDDVGSDVTQVMVQPSIRPDQHHKFDVSINQLAAGENPEHIEVLDLDGIGKRLFALDGHRAEFTVVDVDSTEAATFGLPMSQAAEQLHTYYHDVPGEERIEKRVLVHSSNSSRVAVIRPEQISVGSQPSTPGQAVESIRLSEPPSEVLLKDGDSIVDRAVVLHGGGDDGFTVLNLETNRETSWTGHTLSDVVIDGSHGYGVFANSPHLLRVDLEELRSAEFELPEVAHEVFLSPDNETVLVRHVGQAGRFTVLPRGQLGLEQAVQFEHVFLDGILDRELKEDDEVGDDDQDGQ